MSILRRWGRAAALRAGPLLARHFQPRRVILCYHSIHPSHPFRSATPDEFVAHLRWVSEHCDAVPLSTLVGRRTAPHDGRPQVAITFDDGHVDNYEFALPLLVEHRMPATFYVTTGYIDRDPTVMARLASLRRVTLAEIEPVSWNHLREFTAAGMEIGAHTCTHPNLAQLPPEQLPHEVATSKTEIEQRLGRGVESFAYPFGQLHVHVNGAAIAAAQAAGFKTAVTAAARGVRASDSLFALPRFFASISVDVLATIVRGDRDLLGVIQEHLPGTQSAKSPAGAT